MIDWKIQSRAHACQACAQPFADKQPYYTLLFDKKHTLERLDVCPACWQSQYSQGANDRKGFVSFWQGLFAEPAPPPPEPIQKETAESLLRKLIEQNDPQYDSACFILAVMLERKRILKVKLQTTENGQRTLVYEHAKSADLFTIKDPNLQLHQLDEVQRGVSHLLENGLARPVSATADATTQANPQEGGVERVERVERESVNTESPLPCPLPEEGGVERVERVERESVNTELPSPCPLPEEGGVERVERVERESVNTESPSPCPLPQGEGETGGRSGDISGSGIRSANDSGKSLPKESE